MADDRLTGVERQDLPAERGIAQYHRLASLLRHRIAKGEYALGAQLPPITQLAEDLGVAVVTVRQAYELLSREGLIRSQRGIGTHVAALPAAAGDIELAINDPFAAPEALAFQFSRSAAVRSATGTARGRRPAGPGQRLRAQTAHLFRRAVLLRRDLCAGGGLRLAAQGCRPQAQAARRSARRARPALQACAAAHDRDAGGLPVCDMLKIPFASPVAKMSRRLLDAKGAVLYAGVTWYRGDRYVSEFDFPASTLRSAPGITEPQPRSASERKPG